MKYKRGLFIGRFQPIHKGHIKVIELLLEKVEELIVVIGSSQYSHSFNNPFTAGERLTMVRKALVEAGVDITKLFILPIPDTNDNRIWVSHITASVPHFDVIFTNNPLVERLMQEAEFKVENTTMFQRSKYNSTKIRENIYNEEPWESLVPKTVVEFIKEIDGLNRIKDIGETELKL